MMVVVMVVLAVFVVVVMMLKPKKIIVGFKLQADPCRFLGLVIFCACQKYKIKFSRPPAVEQLQQKYLQSVLLQFTRKQVSLSAAANSAVIMCCKCLFGIAIPE